MTNVRSILSASSARRRDLTAVQQLQAKRDERQARRDLYPRRPDSQVSDPVPSGWRGCAPMLLAEFQVGEFDDGGAAA